MKSAAPLAPLGVFLLLLVPTPILGQTLVHVLEDPVPQANAYLGWDLDWIGDVDGDGVPDVVVSAFGQNMAFVFSGANGVLLYPVDNPTSESGLFGTTPVRLGDVDGDLVPDFAAGAPTNDGTGVDVGQSFVFSGVDGSLIHTLDHPTPQNQAHFGNYNAGVGDIDSDSVPDIAVGAPGPCCAGSAFVFSGLTGSLIHSLNNPDPQGYDTFGYVTGLGDVDGDSIPDIAVSARAYTGSGYGQGRVYVFSGDDAALLYVVEHPEPQGYAWFGVRVVGVGDVSGDSVPDLAVGAMGQTVAGNIDSGRAYVFSGLGGTLIRTLDNPDPQAGALFGGGLAAAGDIDGDGVPDIGITANGQDVGGTIDQGRAFLLSGADGALILALDLPQASVGALFGCDIAFSDDLVAVGACGETVNGNPAQGRAYVFRLEDGDEDEDEDTDEHGDEDADDDGPGHGQPGHGDDDEDEDADDDWSSYGQPGHGDYGGENGDDQDVTGLSAPARARLRTLSDRSASPSDREDARRELLTDLSTARDTRTRLEIAEALVHEIDSPLLPLLRDHLKMIRVDAARQLDAAAAEAAKQLLLQVERLARERRTDSGG